MIKREYKHFFTRKYLLFLLPVFIFAFISGYFTFTSESEGSAYSDFSSYVEFYENQEELQEQYDYYFEKYQQADIVSDDMVVSVDKEEVAKRLYILNFCIDHNLEYDGIIDSSIVTADRKYTSFNYLYSFSTGFIVFAIIACVLIGCCYQTADRVTKTSKLVYTTGEKRNKIIDRKFLVSLSAILGTLVVYYIIVALFSLQLADYTPEYMLYFVNGKLQVMNYFGFFSAMLFSQLLMLTFTYTFIYYFSVAVKNVIAAICTFFVLFAISIFTNTIISPISPELMTFKEFLQGGYMMLMHSGTYEIKYCLLFIPLILGVAGMVTISKMLSSKADYSR